MLKVEFGCLWGRDRFRARKEVGHLGEAINHHQDRVVALRGREFSDEVKRDRGPRSRRNRERRE